MVDPQDIIQAILDGRQPRDLTADDERTLSGTEGSIPAPSTGESGANRDAVFSRHRPYRGKLEHRIAAQRVGVVAVLVSGGNHQHAKPDDLRQAVHDLFPAPAGR